MDSCAAQHNCASLKDKTVKIEFLSARGFCYFVFELFEVSVWFHFLVVWFHFLVRSDAFSHVIQIRFSAHTMSTHQYVIYICKYNQVTIVYKCDQRSFSLSVLDVCPQGFRDFRVPRTISRDCRLITNSVVAIYNNAPHNGLKHLRLFCSHVKRT
jgi:hypothetical protein